MQSPVFSLICVMLFSPMEELLESASNVTEVNLLGAWKVLLVIMLVPTGVDLGMVVFLTLLTTTCLSRVVMVPITLAGARFSVLSPLGLG